MPNRPIYNKNKTYSLVLKYKRLNAARVRIKRVKPVFYNPKKKKEQKVQRRRSILDLWSHITDSKIKHFKNFLFYRVASSIFNTSLTSKNRKNKVYIYQHRKIRVSKKLYTFE